MNVSTEPATPIYSSISVTTPTPKVLFEPLFLFNRDISLQSESEVVSVSSPGMTMQVNIGP